MSDQVNFMASLIISKRDTNNSGRLCFAGSEVAPGTKLIHNHSFTNTAEESTLFIVNGKKPGPVICLTAAIHGDELNGVEIIRQVIDGLDPLTLSGVVIGVPIVNLEGYNAGRRYMDDRSDLNRCFPGSADGSQAKQFAYGFFNQVIMNCDVLIDLHTGSTFRENYPQLRADLSINGVASLSGSFGLIPVVQNIAPAGSLRGAATKAGVPALVMEVGSSRGLEPDKIKVAVQGLKDLLQDIGMTVVDHSISNDQHVFLGSGWVRAEFSGIFVNIAELGDTVQLGDLIAEINDPLTSEVHAVTAPCTCTILGRAHNQHVNQGFGLFRVGVE